MSDSNRANTAWKTAWIISIISALLFSFSMTYAAPLAFAILYPIAQLIGIVFIPNARYSLIWLLHILYWLGLLYSGATEVGFTIGLLGSSFIGEFMLQLILKDLVKWRWLLFNSFAMLILIGCYMLLSQVDKSVNLNPFLVVVIGFSVSAFVSAQGIKQHSEIE